MKTRTSLWMRIICFWLALCGAVVAAEEGLEAQADQAANVEVAVEEAHHAALAKTIQNPLANLVSLPLQFNFNEGGGHGPYCGT